jgi:hypothetical protein
MHTTPIRKQIISDSEHAKQSPEPAWLDLAELADIEITSEAPDYPIEAAIVPGLNQGWRAAVPGKQTIRLLFMQPQHIHRIQLNFQESSVSRAQEYVLRWSRDNDQLFMDIARQQWNFSPEGSTEELEDHVIELSGVTVIELTITPDMSGQAYFASLAKIRIA